MPSLIRRIEKNMLKREGYSRGPSALNEETGLKIGGQIRNSDGEDIGPHYPKYVQPVRPAPVKK